MVVQAQREREAPRATRQEREMLRAAQERLGVVVTEKPSETAERVLSARQAQVTREAHGFPPPAFVP